MAYERLDGSGTTYGGVQAPNVTNGKGALRIRKADDGGGRCGVDCPVILRDLTKVFVASKL